MAQEQRSTLGRDDSTTAALAVDRGGRDQGRGDQALARELGATKGSFYWHFRNRDALLEAALARWEEADAQRIDERAAIPDARARLKDLFGGVLRDDGRVEASLLADDRRPSVAAALARVTARRLEATAVTFAQLGFGLKAARDRALVAYSAYLGLFAVGQADPGEVPEPGPALGAFIEDLLDLLTRI